MSQLDQIELDHSFGANSTNPPTREESSSVSCDLLSPTASLSFLCPGERHPISHSVHLARLASFYSKCRECDHRSDLVELGVRSNESVRITTERGPRDSLLTAEGVRGIYLNELDRTRADRWGAALASMLWDDEPRSAGNSTSRVETLPRASTELRRVADIQEETVNAHLSVLSSATLRRGPVVVIGFDERPAAPDIVTGLAMGLRRMGCQVIDLGQTSASCFRFAVSHLEASAGMFVTGAGCDPAWIGFDVVGRGASPWSGEGKLRELEARAQSGVTRPTRTAGSQRTFQGLVPYEAGLWKHFHALRPLHLVCGSSTRLLPGVIDRLFARLPCRVTHVALPVRQRNLNDAQDRDVKRITAAVTSGGQHLGMIVDDDGQHCSFVTERGRLVTQREIARLLIDMERSEHPSGVVVLAEPLADELSAWLSRHAVNVRTSADSVSDLWTAMTTSTARIGFQTDGRVWFGETTPRCDAIVTLARVLQALSLSDASFDDVTAP